MPWVKLFIDMLDDHKIGKLPRSTRLRFVELLLIAGECDADGGLINGDAPMNLEDIAWRLRDTAEAVGSDIAKLTAAGVLSDDSGVLCITNFSKRQGRSQSDKRAQWRERKARQKENDPKDAEGFTRESRVNHASREEESREEKSREEKNDGAFAPIIIPPPADADIANATAKTDFDALAREAGIHNQPAPRKPRKSPANLTIDTADDERVKAYLRILCQDEITPTNAALIQKRVSDLGLWVATLERWARGNGSESYRPTNFSAMFENYDRRVVAANVPQTVPPAGKPAPLSYFGEGGVLDQAMNAVWGDWEKGNGN
jgi:hypothetical protein